MILEKGGKSAHFEQHVKEKKHNLPYFLRRINCSDLAHLINICAKCAKFKACLQVSLTSSFVRGMKKLCASRCATTSMVQAGFQEKKILKGVV